MLMRPGASTTQLSPAMYCLLHNAHAPAAEYCSFNNNPLCSLASACQPNQPHPRCGAVSCTLHMRICISICQLHITVLPEQHRITGSARIGHTNKPARYCLCFHMRTYSLG